MSDGLAYRFESPAHWQTSLAMALPEEVRIEPDDGEVFLAVAGPVEAFALGTDGAPVWIGDDASLRLDAGCAGPRLGKIQRLVPGRRRLWALTEGGIARLDAASLQMFELIDDVAAIDIAGDGADGLWILSKGGVSRRNADGRLVDDRVSVPFQADQLAASGGSLALLDSAGNRLQLRRDERDWLEIDLANILGRNQPAFRAERLAAAGAAFVLEGKWDGRSGFLLLDSEGEPSAWGAWEDVAPKAIAVAGDDLFALFEEDERSVVRRFPGITRVGGQLWLTPALESDTLAGAWLRADLRVALAEGATLAVRYAASKDEGLRDAAEAIKSDPLRLVGDKVRMIGSQLDWSATRTYLGEAHEGPVPVEDFAFPLHEAQGNFLWLEIRLHGNGAPTPRRPESLVVSHDAPSLMDNLPAVYDGPDGDYDGTLRRLVAILEATTQGVDERVGKLAERLDPARTEARWLPALAALLGLPFDTSLSAAMQRALVAAAPAILAGRGTIAGVRALLDALFGKRPFRIVDRTEQLIPIALGGGGFGGTRLPAFLSGPSRRIPRLNARLVLGRTALCAVAPGDSLSVEGSPELLVVIPASGRERRRYGAAIFQMISSLIPAGVRLRLRWTARGAAGGRGGLLAVVGDAAPLRLGGDQALGRARVGGKTDRGLRADGIPALRRLR